MIHLGACLDRLQDAMRREFIATPSELFSQELGSYDTISKVHVECLPADSSFLQFSTVAIACLKCDEKDQAWFYFWFGYSTIQIMERRCRFERAEKRLSAWLTWSIAFEDHWCFLSVCESYRVVVSFVFLFKTSRARTPETPEDYCKLSSGDVFRGEQGREGRQVWGPSIALLQTAPKTRKSIIWGVQII